MKYLVALSLLIGGWCNAALGTSAPDGFTALLEEAELVYQPPQGFSAAPPGRTPIMDYEHALRSSGGALEIRVAVRPLKRLRIDYDDPHGSAPDPNHVFPLVFESMASRLAGGTHAPSRAYSPQQARADFNADWAAAAVFDVVDEFSRDYQQGLLLAIHRNNVSDAYVVFLFDDYKAVKPTLNQAMQTVVFKPLPAAGDKP